MLLRSRPDCELHCRRYLHHIMHRSGRMMMHPSNEAPRAAVTLEDHGVRLGAPIRCLWFAVSSYCDPRLWYSSIKGWTVQLSKSNLIDPFSSLLPDDSIDLDFANSSHPWGGLAKRLTIHEQCLAKNRNRFWQKSKRQTEGYMEYRGGSRQQQLDATLSLKHYRLPEHN